MGSPSADGTTICLPSSSLPSPPPLPLVIILATGASQNLVLISLQVFENDYCFLSVPDPQFALPGASLLSWSLDAVIALRHPPSPLSLPPEPPALSLVLFMCSQLPCPGSEGPTPHRAGPETTDHVTHSLPWRWHCGLSAAGSKGKPQSHFACASAQPPFLPGVVAVAEQFQVRGAVSSHNGSHSEEPETSLFLNLRRQK